MHRKLPNRPLAWTLIGVTTMALNSTAWAAKPSPLRIPKSYPRLADQTEDAKPVPANDVHESISLHAAGTSVGSVEVVHERYPNGKTRIERQVTLDQQGNYVNHGAWKMWTPTGTVIAEGQYDMGQRIGTWTRWIDRGDSPILGQFPFNRFQAPFISQASFTDGAMDGEWLIIDSEQRKCVQISLSMGKRNGPVIMWLPNGKTYRQATYDQGVPVGDFFDAGKTGELELTATYVDGRKIVTKTTHHNRGRQKKTEELYLAATTIEKTADDFWNLRFADYAAEGQDLRHGPSKAWYENGVQQHEGLYQQDKKNGPFTYWHPNGQVSAAGEFKDDQPEGLWVAWHENGQKASIGEYRTGILVGRWRWWDEAGQLAKQRVYDGSEAITSDPQEVPKLSRATEAEASAR